ncbi:expressed unknown protein [Seminavis robusta]|uniref:Uncharacterized protein n=1 Tax=Seminavis robusta TaxID=568900 RepID=A0A9N8EEP0_9STRA|nr:expressed unknown protein [Seminavis robusta]|eukprot:Sro967_g225890.1 n/a (190) ;mRNA; f:32473-33042
MYNNNKNNPLIHNPAFAMPFPVIEIVAEVLLQEPRVVGPVLGTCPTAVRRFLLINILHVLTSILMDLMLSSSVSVHNGAYSMEWTFSQKKAHDTYTRYWSDPVLVRKLLQEALERIDFDVVEQEAKQATPWMGQQQVYAMAYKVMLIVFYIINQDTECRFMGRSVRQRFDKPSSSSSSLLVASQLARYA